MSDPIEVDRLHALLPQIKEEAFNRVSHSHPDGAKVRWLTDFADEHRSEPMVVHTHDPQTAEMLSERLSQGGHRVGTVAPYDEFSDNEDARSRAILSVFPHSGTPSAHILVTSDPTVVESAPTRRFHLISHDHPYINGSEEGIAPLSIHDLAVDNNHDRVHAESSQVGADGVEKAVTEDSTPYTIQHVWDGYKGRLDATDESREPIGQLDYWKPARDLAEISSLWVHPAHQRKGIGSALYQNFARQVARLHPDVKRIGGEVTSQGVLRLRNRIFGRPTSLDDSISNLSLREAMNRLPELSPQNEEGIVEDAPKIYAINRFQPDIFFKGIKHDIKEAVASIDPDPSHPQIRAGNYQKAHIRLHGLDITLENKRGSTRRGVDPTGKHWHRKLTHHYGYIRRVGGVSAGRDADGDHTDVFIGPHVKSQRVFVVDQVSVGTHVFDEHKVLLGFRSVGAARKGYLSNYDPDWKGLGAITEVSLPTFKAWLRDGGGNKKPFAPESELKKAADDLQ